MITRFRSASVLIAGLLVLSACNKTRPVADDEYNDPRYQGPFKGSLSGDGGLFNFGGSKKDAQSDGAGLGVNAYLWRGTLDTLSFMPLASADPFGGVIITDWSSPPAGNGAERFKATAYILGRQLRADGIKVSIFRQVLQNGQWIDSAVSPGTVTEIENKVLARARELRSQSAGG